VVEALARQLGLRVIGVKTRPFASVPVRRTRVALYRPWGDAIDEGWTRWLFEQYGVPFTTLRDADARKGALAASYDVIVLPAVSAQRLIDGSRAGSLPEEYLGGLGQAGVDALKVFVEGGGTLVTLDASSQLAIDALKLPVKNIVRDAPVEKFFCPGSLLRLDVDTTQPLGFGMTPRTAAFFAFSAAWDVSAAPGAKVIARYGEKDVLLSGWLEGESLIAGQPAVVDVRAGAGRVVLIGFRAQHRGQAYATFRLLFNALLTGTSIR
jgi:hypothetical protein